MKVTAKDVALAICRVSPMAGQELGRNTPQPVEVRAKNLLRDTKYGPYIADGDPSGWGGDGTVATLYLEPRGSNWDCVPPLDYYEGGLEVSCLASSLLPGGFYIEFVNAAVAVVNK